MAGFVYTFGKRVYDLESRTHIMGILNVTPDSFSDGGKFLDAGKAVSRAHEMIGEGADIIDIGGESTRPKSNAYGEGAESISADEELARVLPVIQRLTEATDVPISIDTYKSAVAEQALDAGAVIVNDISGFTFDRRMSTVVAKAHATVVLMHIKGTPKTMQMNPAYGDLIGEIAGHLSAGIREAREKGIRQVLVDVGLGFGKLREHNLQLIKGLAQFKELGCPIVIGPSRKAFIGEVLNLPVLERREGTLAAVVASVLHGANVVRVHDVKEAKHATRVADVILRA